MQDNKIPRVIHYCWLSGDPFPPRIQQCIDSWKKNLPGYELRLWDTDAFDIDSVLWVKQAYEQRKFAFAADYIRLYALYSEGGIYLDSDVEVVKPFDDLLQLPYFACTEGDNIIEAGAMGATKGLGWLRDCLAYYENRSFIKNDNRLDTWPLPQVMMEQIKVHYLPEVVPKEDFIKNVNHYEADNKFYMLPKEYFCAKDMGTGIIQKTDETYCIHHFEMSWMPKSHTFLPNLKRRIIRIIGVDAVNALIHFFALKKIKDTITK
ncbi:MAG: glycosyl transferase [Weeksellaceae bacterium]|nr:glycosyl transferase [Weeksellaceae bacterium]